MENPTRKWDYTHPWCKKNQLVNLDMSPANDFEDEIDARDRADFAKSGGKISENDTTWAQDLVEGNGL